MLAHDLRALGCEVPFQVPASLPELGDTVVGLTPSR
jgi:hypothetical protein